ncbi:MAG: ribosome maturation factor RimM [Polyangiaceae bacterium]
MNAIELGRITKPHGLVGELKLRLHWDQSTALDGVETLWLVVAGERREFAVQRARRAGLGYLVKLVGVDDRDAADALRGARVEVARDALPPLAAGEYYLGDLLGFAVKVSETVIGHVREVQTHPSLDSVVIELEDGRRVEQPLVEPWLVAVDLALGCIELSGTDAFIE